MLLFIVGTNYTDRVGFYVYIENKDLTQPMCL